MSINKLLWFLGGGVFNPSSLNNKVFHFKAGSESDGEVATWTDQFGLRNAVTVATRNTPNQVDDSGKKAMLFTRANNEILRSSAKTGLTDYSLFVVFKANGTTLLQKLVGNGGVAATANGFDVNIESNLIKINNRNTSSQQQKTFAFTDTSNYHVLCIKWQTIGTGTTISYSRTVFKLDNVVMLVDIDSKVLQSNSSGFDIGSDSSNNSFDGYIREMICINEFATESTERNIYSYFNSTWGLSVTTTMPAYSFGNGIVPAGAEAKTATLGTAALAGDYFSMSNVFDGARTPMPVLLCVHGYSETADTLTDLLGRASLEGWFAISVQMRGRGSSTGTRDSGGQEVYDIYDVYQQFLSKYSGYNMLDPNRVMIVGYSGGGGDAMAFGARFPDLCSSVVIHFGISDYGYDGTYSWYIEEVSRQAQLNTDVGSPRTSFLNEYRTRNTVEAIAKNLQSTLFIFHDDQDTQVNIDQSSRVKDQYTAESRTIQETKYGAPNSDTDLLYSVTTIGDPTRWTHGNPTTGASIVSTELQWLDDGYTRTIPTMPDTGTIKILGWIRTKKFYILLGNGTAANNGKTRSADLTYDWVNNSYTVTPLLESGAADETVSILVIGGSHDGKTASGTISVATLFTPT